MAAQGLKPTETVQADAWNPALAEGESVAGQGKGLAPLLTVCVPAYRDDASPLIAALSDLEGADRAALVLYDDGSNDSQLTARHVTTARSYPGRYAIVADAANHGRAHARNRLAALAASDWLLFLDADMLPDDGHFLTRYYAAMEQAEGPGLIVGGFTVRATPRSRTTSLHHAQSVVSDSISASGRSQDPGRFVFTSNLLVHRSVLETVPFDPGFTGWGWEDVDWGLRVVDRFPVHHIDNTATHLGLVENTKLIRRFATSGGNFARMAERHPDAAARMPLMKVARMMQRLPFRKAVAATGAWAARDPLGLLPMALRLRALKFMRAARYAEHLPPAGQP